MTGGATTGHGARHDPRPEVIADKRPWGGFRQYTDGEPSTVKLITVAAGEALSLQRHAHRDELWIVLDDGLTVQIGDDEAQVAQGDECWIPRGTVHRVAAGATTGRFVEVAFGAFDEGDVERLDDRYGRHP